MKLSLLVDACSSEEERSASLCDINFRTLGLFLLSISAASLHVLPLSHSLCLPVTLFSSWLACLSSKLSVADVNGPCQHVLLATCVATCVTMGEVLFSFFFFFSKASFYFCFSRSLDLSHIKSLLHIFSFGSLVSSMQRTCPVQQNGAFIRLLQRCLCNHFAELCYS